MRTHFFDALFRHMASDERVFLVVADMGINLVERFAETYPERFVNVGIAEQNLIGVCAGLCNAGYRPFAYTISNFLIHRCFEQIRNDAIVHQYPITLVGTSTGYDNGPLGPTHHVIDDWGCLSGLGDIDIYCPSDTFFAETLVERVLDRGRPAYVRIPKGSFEPLTVSGTSATDSRTLQLIQFGTESADSQRSQAPATELARQALVVSYGSALPPCIDACRENQIDLLITQQLWPHEPISDSEGNHRLAESELISIVSRYRRVLVVEDHLPATGLFGLLCRNAFQSGLRSQIDSRGPSGYDLTVGTGTDFACEQARSVEDISRWIRESSLRVVRS